MVSPDGIFIAPSKTLFKQCTNDAVICMGRCRVDSRVLIGLPSTFTGFLSSPPALGVWWFGIAKESCAGANDQLPPGSVLRRQVCFRAGCFPYPRPEGFWPSGVNSVVTLRRTCPYGRSPALAGYIISFTCSITFTAALYPISNISFPLSRWVLPNSSRPSGSMRRSAARRS